MKQGFLCYKKHKKRDLSRYVFAQILFQRYLLYILYILRQHSTPINAVIGIPTHELAFLLLSSSIRSFCASYLVFSLL